MKTLLIGATGTIGQETVKALTGKGVRPVAAVRDTDRARKQLGPGVDYIFFDYYQPESYLPALEGVDRLFFIAPKGDLLPAVQGLLRAAHETGLQYIVFSSGRTTGDMEGKPLHQIEKTVQAGNIPYTILRPGWFMQNFAGWLGEWIPPEGKIYLPAGDSKTAFIDVRDIGAVAATLLAEGGHNGEIYELTSNEAIDHYEVARLIGKAAGREVTYVPMPPDDFIELMVEKGWPRSRAEHTAGLYEWVRQGKEAVISPDVENILGRRPIRFAEFVQDYGERWK